VKNCSYAGISERQFIPESLPRFLLAAFCIFRISFVKLFLTLSLATCATHEIFSSLMNNVRSSSHYWLINSTSFQSLFAWWHCIHKLSIVAIKKQFDNLVVDNLGRDLFAWKMKIIHGKYFTHIFLSPKKISYISPHKKDRFIVMKGVLILLFTQISHTESSRFSVMIYRFASAITMRFLLTVFRFIFYATSLTN
jgi:hypothetical protein